MGNTIWRKIVGWAFLIFGFIALITPVLPGSWLIFVGAEMLGIEILSRGNILQYYEKVRQWFITKNKDKDSVR